MTSAYNKVYLLVDTFYRNLLPLCGISYDGEWPEAHCHFGATNCIVHKTTNEFPQSFINSSFIIVLVKISVSVSVGIQVYCRYSGVLVELYLY